MAVLYSRASQQAKLLEDNHYTTPRVRFELLFYEPLDETTRSAAKTLLYQHPDHPGPLVSDAVTGIPGRLKGVDSRTRDNYYAILEVFRPAMQSYPTDKETGNKLYSDKFACATLLNFFSKAEEPDDLPPQMRPYLEACRPYLKKNKPTPELREAIHQALNVFSESRPFDPLVLHAFDTARPHGLNLGYRDNKGDLKTASD